MDRYIVGVKDGHATERPCPVQCIHDDDMERAVWYEFNGDCEEAGYPEIGTKEELMKLLPELSEEDFIDDED